MTYVKQSAYCFYLWREALIPVDVISKDFPKVGSADEECTVDDGIAPCGCPARTAPPSQPTELRLPYTPENILAMKEWLIQRYF